MKLSESLTLFKRDQNFFLKAGIYFLFKQIQKKQSPLEFIYGKTFGYIIKRLSVLERSSRFTAFIEAHLKDFPHLHLPQAEFVSSKEHKKYYKRLASFYVGIFSWFNV